MESVTKITDADKETLRKYLDEMDALAKSEPLFIASDEKAANAWNEWHNRCIEVNIEYKAVVSKILATWFSDLMDDDLTDAPQSVPEIVRAILDGDKATPTRAQLVPAVRNLMQESFVPVLYGELTNILFGIEPKQFTKDPFTGVSSYEKNGIMVEIEGGLDSLTSSALKLLDAVIAYFAFNNPYGIKQGINIIVEMPLIEYAAVRGIDLNPRKMDTEEEQKKENKKVGKRKRAFIRDIERDLDSLEKFRITARIKRGRNAGDYEKIAIISADHGVTGDIIQATIPPRAAKYLLNSYVMSYDTRLQGLDDRNPSTYRIGRKMLQQACIDQNTAAGTANTLKVKTLIACTPHIPDLEKLQARGETNWKDKQKEPLETVLNHLIKADVLTDWYYCDPRTKENYTPETVAGLTAATYNNLNVIFEPAENPQLNKRKEKILAPAFDEIVEAETPESP